MRQISRKFSTNTISDFSVESQLNKFLEKNPEFRVSSISYCNECGTCVEHLFVVFDIITDELSLQKSL